MKVFGVGLNKTGTSTLAKCFKTLGYKHSSHRLGLIENVINDDLGPVYDHIDNFDSFEDWPWPLIYKQLDHAYPGSKFILTTRRDPETWFNSLRKHANRTGPTNARKMVYGYSMPHKFKKEHITFYKDHNRNVKEYFKNRPDDFIELCWENGDAWEELCGFLNHQVPDNAFPHANRGHGYIRVSLHKMKSKLLQSV